MTDLSIRPVNAVNWRPITALTLKRNQQEFIESNAVSILESFYDTGNCWRCFGLYQRDHAVGFIMIGAENKAEKYIWLDRFMIDSHYQGKGLGGRFLSLITAYIDEHFNVGEIVLSVMKENKAAKSFYERCGFSPAGLIDPENGEEIFTLSLEE
ncbi:GNAT family N-acetyltransferase [Alkalicoccus halolimnae]|uniref:GNAT family N-acetyltransferase n=1 Tax=Alkalicoccus halolimnae TaxID=1667239 RepID=A0A5C7FDY8_9BACI|nr:GNAT family N-acetyltransferase [Alkalicoccus halolimnae]TXF83584.1 GNAT family N-acetyltransferase [Alkalicoccus halolimnae]